MSLALANARNLLKKLNISSIADIDIEDICFREKLFIQTEDNLECEGRILFSDEMAIITIERNIIDTSHKRFVIAHEMGHFYNERNFTAGKNKFYNCTGENFWGIRGVNKNTNEINANLFAAELLMPNELIKNICKGEKFSIKLINKISSTFNVSLTAAAIRLSELDIFPIAIFMTTNAKVSWVSISEGFRYKFIPIGMKVSSLSYADDYYQNKPIPDEEDIPAEAWFKQDYTLRNYNDRIFEIVIPMKRYNSAMVVLYC
ncbi:MAG: ImmA/IrrE family metallo-endopeptidase [Ignavibacteriales bacterium]